MKIRNVLVTGLLTFLLFASVVLAEGEDRTCTYTNLASAKKIASKVTASYEIQYENDIPYFNITVYNVTDDIIVAFISDLDRTETEFVSNYMAQDGVYTFRNYNITDIEKYTIEISSTKYDCDSLLRTFTLTKPKRNIIHDDPECSYAESVNSYFCQEWIKRDFPYSYQTIIKKIKAERINKENKKTITKKKEDTKNKSFFEKIKGVTLYIIIGLLVAILIDTILIIIDIVKIRKDNDF